MIDTETREVTLGEVTKTQVQPKIVYPGEGETIEAFGDSLRVILTSEDTANQIAMGEDTTPPGSGPPLHVHTGDDEIFIIQSGCYEFQVDGESVEVGPGTVIYGPHEVPHTFRVVGNEPGRMFIIVSPGGFDHFFRRCAVEFATGAPDMNKIIRISDEHGITCLRPESVAASRSMRTGAAVQPKIVRPGEGETFEVFGERIRVILTSAETGGRFTMGELEEPTGLGPPLHVHTRENEIWMIQSGRFEFQVGDDTFEVGPGAVVYGPRNIPHRFRAISETPGRFYGIALPGGIEGFFMRSAEAIGAGDPDRMKIAQIASEYGIFLLPQEGGTQD